MKQPVEIVYPCMEVDGELVQREITTPYEYDVYPLDDETDVAGTILSRIWRDMNVVDGSELPVQLKIRSSMVGDVYTLLKSEIIPVERHFIVDGVGFLEVTARGKELWLSTPYQQRGFISINRAVLANESIGIL